ncbi:Gcsh [Symbiodinium sp. KB8]|nr:Gcsh [Symbiodinium sp. KB8]
MFRALLCTALLVQTRSWECPAGFAGPEKCLGKENAGKCELQKPSKVDIDTNNALSCGNPNAKLAEFETDLGGGSYYKGCGLNQDGLVDSCCNCWPLKEAASNEVKIVPISNAEDRPSAFDDDPASDSQCAMQQANKIPMFKKLRDMDLCFVGLFEVVAQAAVPNGFDIGVTSTGLGEWVITRFWSPGHLENLEFMSSTGAGFVDVVVADLVAPPTSKSATSASPLEASPAPGEIGENAGQPTMGAQAGGIAGSPSTGTSALVETAVADEDPVMGVPPSSDEEEELLADVVGAQHFPGVDVVDGEAQTVHFTPILAFDAHDVGVQTANEVMFSSFVGDTSREALATAIRALSRDDRDRLVGALRLAEEQPLVDVAPAGGAGDPSSSSGPPLDLLDLTPGQPSGPTGVVDPGPSPATARTFWEEQDATAVAEMAAAKPVPDDDIDAGPPTSLEVFLAEQEPPKAAPKEPPMPCPDKPIRFLPCGAAADTPDGGRSYGTFGRAGLLLLPEGATYQEALESSIARELAEERQAADVGQPFGAQLGHHPSRGAANLVFDGLFHTVFGAYPVEKGQQRPPATDFAIPAGRQGGPGGLWHQEPESPTAGAGTQHLGRLPVPAPRTGADLRHKEIPYSVVGWTADTWEEAERLEAAIASGASTPPQSVSAGVILRSLPPHVRGGRLPRERPADFTKWIGWCFVKCPDTVGGGLAPTTPGSSFATMGPPRGSFAELVALAERTGQSEVLPLLARAGARNIDDLTARADRLRTWNRLAFEGKVPAWPISTRTLAVIGAAFRAGGIPPALAPLVNFADRAAFDPARAAHSADVFVIAVWFMLREIEVAAARVSDMVVSPGLAVRQCGTDAAPGRPGHAWASDEQEFFAGCTRPWLHGFHSPGGQRWVVCPRALRVNDRRALLAMWRQARVHLDWLAEDTPGRAYAPFWGLASLPARWAPQWAVHTHQTGDSDDDPMFGCFLDADIPEFEPPRRVLEWPVVPTGDFAPGTSSTAGTTTWLVWGRGPGWCTPLAAKGRRTRSPGAGGASRATGLSPWFGPRRPPSWALPWQWCRECWAGRCISRGDHENDLMPELE